LRALTIQTIGKDANLIEQQEAGVLLGDPQAAYASPLELDQLRARLSAVSIRELAARSGLSERMLRAVRDGSRRPAPATARAFTEMFRESQSAAYL
jgi:hypothetical protein